VDLLVVLYSRLKADWEDCHSDVAAEGVERVCNVVGVVATPLCFNRRCGFNVVVLVGRGYAPNG
jgi:hypothetical protein